MMNQFAAAEAMAHFSVPSKEDVLMAIDVFSERVISLKEATRLLPKTSGNRTLHYNTMFCRILGGLRAKDGSWCGWKA